MQTLEFIRTRVLRCSRSEMARIAGVHRSTIKRWVEGESEPTYSQVCSIRTEILVRGLPWVDEWMFQVPKHLTGEFDRG